MTDLVYDFITTGVDLLLIGAVLAAMIVMMRGSTQLTQLISNQQTTTDEFDLYLKYHMYDNQDGLSTADAISAMVGYRFDLTVCIKDGSTYYVNDPDTGKYYVISSSDGSDPYLGKSSAEIRTEYGAQKTYSELSSELSSTNLYHADLIVMNDGVFAKETYSRDVIVLGIMLEKNN